MDFTLYWFMFPVSILVATTAMLSGIGGAALFMPIFILLFPLLGPEYMLATPVAAVGVALLTEFFGFSSGFIGYFRKRLIDFYLAKTFLMVSVPAAIAGALIAHHINSTIVIVGYGVLILIIAGIMFRGHEILLETEVALEQGKNGNSEKYRRQLTDRKGNTYEYNHCSSMIVPTGLGGFLTGLLSVGIGETVMPQLVRFCRTPVPVAAATSILVVIITVMSASFTHIITLINAGGLQAVPWHLVAYTIPGVIIGGQIGPALQGRIASHLMERVIATLFTCIGIVMLWTSYNNLFPI